MKAILKIGRFTSVISIYEVRPDIYIPSPAINLALSAMPPKPDEDQIKKWCFRYVKRLEGDIYLYEFWEES